MKRINPYIVFLVALFVVVVYFEATAPRPVSWESSFTRQDRIPFGGYILFDLLPQLFPESDIAVASSPAYNVLVDSYRDGTNYIFINNYFAPDALDVEQLLEFVDRGNHVFMAATDFSPLLSDSLGFEVGADFSPFSDTVSVNFSSPSLKESPPFTFKGRFGHAYFGKIDTANTVILGTDGDGAANFIRVSYGDGDFIASTVPYAFTNYHLVDERNAEYVFRALSYVPDGAILWDEYYKAGRKEVRSPLRYILSEAPLRWAWYLTLIGVVLFMIFMGRRRQRIIPTIKPLPNATLEFAETVGQLYYRHGNHGNIAGKKITYFLEYIRTHFGLNTAERDDEFYRMVAARSGIELDVVRSTFDYIDATIAQQHVTDERLLALNAAIDRFYAESRR